MALADLVLELRLLCKDTASSHIVYGESLGNLPGQPVDGSNTKFRLGGQDGHTLPVVASSVYVTIVGSSFRTQSGFTLSDAANGILTFSPAPSNGAQVLVDYNYYWFADAFYNEFLTQAAQMALAGTTDSTSVPEGLKEAMMQYALYLFYGARASQYAERYSSSGGEAGQSVESVAKVYLSLANAAKKRADEIRDDYYKRQGQRHAPASATVSYQIDPITPIR